MVTSKFVFPQGFVINNKSTQGSEERKRSHCDEESTKFDALVGKKVNKKHGKEKGPLKIVESSTKIQKKNDKCHFCGKSRHFQINCPKCKA